MLISALVYDYAACTVSFRRKEPREKAVVQMYHDAVFASGVHRMAERLARYICQDSLFRIKRETLSAFFFSNHTGLFALWKEKMFCGVWSDCAVLKQNKPIRIVRVSL